MHRADELLSKIQQTNPSLHAEDAFVVPLWFQQQQSWVHNPGNSDNAIYNYPLAVRIRGPLRCEVLQRSLQHILQRHNVLRSVFRIVDEELVQIVTPAAPICIPIVELNQSQTGSASDLEARARHMAVHAARQSFDLSRGPLLRAMLFRLDREDHVLLLTTHHLVYDDWSTGILLRELAELYSAEVAGSTAALPALSFTYGDFVRWLQKWMQGKSLENRLDFWTRELAGGKDFHHLQTDNPRPECRTYHGKCASVVIPEEVTHSLRTLSQQERVSLYMVLLAGFQCLLHKCSGEEDVAVGSCTANRPLSQVEGLIGRFGNDLVLRTDLGGDPTFRELFARVRKTSLTAFSYQDVPFGKVVNELQSWQTPGRNPLFQVMFILQDAPKLNCEIPGLRMSFFPLELGTAKYDLNVWLRPKKGLEVVFEYNSNLFKAETMERMLEHYQQLLSVMVKNPDARISQLPQPSSATRLGPEVSCEARPNLAVTDARKDLGRADDKMEATLVTIWESVLATRPISVTDNYFELGGTSLLAVRLFARIEESLGLKIPLATLIEAPTIEKLANVMRQQNSRERWHSLVTIHSGGSRLPLFCAHGQSGNVLFYRSLAQYLGPDQPVYGLQPAGLDGRQPPLTRIEDMAASYVRDIQAVQSRGPYFLAGYCMGGSIALEMAQQLLGQGQTVGLVALLDTYNFGKIRSSLLADLRFIAEQCWFGWTHFLLTNSTNKRAFLRRRLDDVWDSTSELLDCNERAALSYVAKDYPGRILHIQPMRQYARYRNPELGWDRLAVGSLETFTLPIYPGQMFEEPFVRDLAAKLRACMDEVAGEVEDDLLSFQDKGRDCRALC